MSYEPIQEDIGIGIEIIKKPQKVNLFNFKQYIQWKNITIYLYQSKKERFPFIQIRNKVLYAYNYGNYNWVIVYSELVKFFNHFDTNSKGEKRTLKQTYDNFAYHLKQVKEEGHFYYIEDRNEIAVTEFFRNIENPQEHILLIPYTTFWALLESYNPQIAKDILKELHAVDYKRSMEDDQNQTLIEQIKGDKAYIDKVIEYFFRCRTIEERMLFIIALSLFPKYVVRADTWKDKTHFKRKMCYDISIGKLRLEAHGGHHYTDLEQMIKDIEKKIETIASKEHLLEFPNELIRAKPDTVKELISLYIQYNPEVLE